MLIDGWTAFGTRATGARLERMKKSPQWQGGRFVNPQPLWNDTSEALLSWTKASPHTNPTEELPVARGDGSLYEEPPATRLRATWLGHSTVLLEIDGLRVLTDPIWGERSSPHTWVGPRRWYAPPVPLEALPKIDAVVISHDHFDHLNHPTIAAMKDRDTKFVVPLGVGAHLVYWGVPEEHVVELDWWEKAALGKLEIVCVPARHASGRNPFLQNRTLWAGFAILGPAHRVYFSGDTGLFPGLQDIGDRSGPFDLTMIEVGAYHRAWPDWHIGPEQAIRGHQMVRGRIFLPVHWGMWNLAMHGWTEPVERVLAAAEITGIEVTVPRPGESIEPENLPPLQRWWPELPWDTAEEHPIVSTKMP